MWREKTNICINMSSERENKPKLSAGRRHGVFGSDAVWLSLQHLSAAEPQPASPVCLADSLFNDADPHGGNMDV